MKNLIILALLAIGMISCAPNPDETNNKNLALVKKYVQSVETLDYQTMADALDDRYIGMGPSYGDSITKTKAVQNWKWAVDNLYEKIQYSRSRFVAATVPDGDNRGEWVSNWAELTITYKNGRGSVTVWTNSTYQVRNGKIVKSFTFYNEADILRQLGYVIMPVQTAK